ncbi:MAG: tail fiber domain-containing protein [Candidatus Marinimicrobia bacterium]|nr:tail fiber domain-containing protein [Candidatus Neomarinimicrobiota bacterium]
MRQTIINLFSLIIIISFAFGQTLSIQGVIRDDTGASVDDGAYSIDFRLYTSATATSSAWNETQSVNVVNGVYSAALGSVNSMAGLDFNVEYWLGISIESAEELTPRTKLTLSPYAVIASVSGTNVFPENGNVGIGVASPASKLQVAGAIKVTGASGTLITNTTETGGGGDAFRIRYDNHLFGSNLDGLIFEKLDENGSYPDGGMMFVNTGESGVAVPALSIRGNGNIGIGINNPTHKLDIRGPIRNDHTATTYDVWIQGGSASSGEARNLAILGHKSQDKLYLNYYAEYQNGTILGGNVGIGTASPTSKLHVAGGNIRVHDAESGSGILRVGAAWGYPAVYGDNSTKPLALGSATQKVYFKDCSVGIGTENPVERLHVVGDTYITNKLFVGENLYQRVDGTSQGWHKIDDDDGNDDAQWYETSYTPSDRRLKSAIETIPNAMEKIAQLRGVYYQWSDEGFGRFTQHIDEDFIAGPEATESENQQVKDFYKEKIYQRMGGKQVGVIAQELQEVVPELVQEQEDGYLEVSYGNLVALLIEGMKEQQATIEELENRLDVLEQNKN